MSAVQTCKVSTGAFNSDLCPARCHNACGHILILCPNEDGSKLSARDVVQGILDSECAWLQSHQPESQRTGSARLSTMPNVQTWPMHFCRRNSRLAQAKASSWEDPSLRPWREIRQRVSNTEVYHASRQWRLAVTSPLQLQVSQTEDRGCFTRRGAIKDASVIRFVGGGPPFEGPATTNVSPLGTSRTVPRNQGVAIADRNRVAKCD